jgi:hypothetical protein
MAIWFGTAPGLGLLEQCAHQFTQVEIDERGREESGVQREKSSQLIDLRQQRSALVRTASALSRCSCERLVVSK